VEDLFFHLLGERKIFNFVVCLPLSSLVFDKKKNPENFLFHLIPEENEHAKQKGKKNIYLQKLIATAGPTIFSKSSILTYLVHVMHCKISNSLCTCPA
jgi:hypothetical protein